MRASVHQGNEEFEPSPVTECQPSSVTPVEGAEPRQAELMSDKKAEAGYFLSQ